MEDERDVVMGDVDDGEHIAFARDGWGDIAPHLFDYVAEGGYEDDDDAEDAAGLEQVLERVVVRIRR